MQLRWERDTARHHGFKMIVAKHVFYTFIEHGGGWWGVHKGPRGAMLGGEAFYGPERARLAREWCEKEARKLKHKGSRR